MKIEWMEKYLNEAEQLIYDNRVNEGIELLSNLLYDEPGYGFLHNHLGWAYMYYTPDVAKAEMHLKFAIKFDGEYPAPFIHLGNLLIQNNRLVEAVGVLQQGLHKPAANRAVFQEAIGRAWELRGEFAKAIKAYREGIIASMAEHEINNLQAHVARCRKKRWVAVFMF
jgi:tetratricopeptide (TPR) repeat protein